MSANGCDDIISVIQKRLDMVSHGACCISRASKLAQKPHKENDIIRPDEVETSLTAGLSRTVAAATGRGFKSRQPNGFAARDSLNFIDRECTNRHRQQNRRRPRRSTSTFFGAARLETGSLDRVRILRAVSGGTTPVTRARRVTAFHGSWCGVKSFRARPTPLARNAITKQGPVEAY